MVNSKQKRLSELAADFTVQRDWISIAALFADWSIYAAAVVAAVVVSPIWGKLIAALIAGTSISMLFVLGHDAAHRSLVTSKKWNGVLARLVFLPCMHNFTLWLIQHNRLHHQSTNVKGLNSYSPLSPEEYSKLSFGQRMLERFYRSPAGFGVYYLVERWWRDKFIPRAQTIPDAKARAWGDFAIILGWTSLFAWSLVQIDAMFGDSGPIWAIFWGLVLPFLIWNQLMGTTAFLQHTHPLVPWFRTRHAAREASSQVEVTVLVRYPAWYDVLSHNIMQHQAHHVSARIPWYRLKAAQCCLTPVLGSDVVVESMSIRYVLKLVRHCCLYDYESRQWVKYSRPAQRAKIGKVVSGKSRHFVRGDQLSLRQVDKSGNV
jgi:omega-6 fatty acid desaturase (delta-12 desaturase)